MAISFTRYVDITSSVQGGAQVPRRNLIGRLFDTNDLIPPQSFITFDNAAEVADYFGSTSEEYFRALYYFSFISKNGNSPQLLSFARWVDTATPPMIFGAAPLTNMAVWTSITSGSFSLSYDGNQTDFTGIDFSSAASLADVASIVEAAINANPDPQYRAVPPKIVGATTVNTSIPFWNGISDGSFSLTINSVQTDFTGLDFSAVVTMDDVAAVVEAALNANVDPQYQTATVTFDSLGPRINFVGGDPMATTGFAVIEGVVGTPIANDLGWLSLGTIVTDGSQATVTYNALGPQFNFVGNNAVPTTNFMVIEGTAGTPIAGYLGWLGVGVIIANGSLPETITNVLSTSAQASDDFGSFAFMPILTQDQIVEAATWNYGQNVKFMYQIPCTNLNAASLSAALRDIGGCDLTLSLTNGEYPEMLPMMILAATNYNAPNAVQNYMYQQSTLTPSVDSDTSANAYDTLLVNYYGVTQSAGQFVAFYQRGFMMGLTTSPQFMNIYANEIWLKDAIGSSIMNLLLAVGEIPANNQGITQILTIIQATINEALINGTISVNKKLTPEQIQAINAITGDPNAWYQVQTIGYWMNCTISQFTANNNVVQQQANYTLVYSKDDVINKVTGQQILI